MTPFKNKFPNAEKETVFVVTQSQSDKINKGDKIKLMNDDGSTTPWFYNISTNDKASCAYISNIELECQEPQFAFGEEVQVRDDYKHWHNRWFAYDTHDLKDQIELPIHNLKYRHVAVNENGGSAGWTQIRKLPQTQTVTLGNGDVLTVSNEFAQEIRDSAIDGEG